MPGRFYLEAEADAPVWSWVLGDGLMGGVNCLVPVRPRGMFRGDPAASLVVGELMPAGLVKDVHFRRDERRALYEGLVGKVGREGVFYRVSWKRMKALQFARGWREGRVRLAVSRSEVEWVVGLSPLPIFFMHGRMPLFRDAEQRAEAWEMAAELVGMTVEMDATWARPAWGLGPGDDHGEGHYLWAVLKVIERLHWGWADVADMEPWQRARRFFQGVKFVEQVFGASWVGRVVYEKARGEELAMARFRLSGLRIEIVERCEDRQEEDVHDCSGD